MSHGRGNFCLIGLWHFLVLLGATCLTMAQGTLGDYQRAQRFLPGNVRQLSYIAVVTPNWIEKTNRFWYLKSTAQGSQFILVDAENNTSGPAFDQAKLANALSAAAKRTVEATQLPFSTFEFADGGKSIHFAIENNPWICDLSNYSCSPQPDSKTNPYERLSPDKRWAAYVKDHNLFLRNTSTGQILQLTSDGVAGYDYAVPLPALGILVRQGSEDAKQPPAAFWSPDSLKLVTYRLDSRNAGHFTSIQFVPPDQLRPKAFTYVYPLPGESLPYAEPIVFHIPSGKRVDIKTAPIEIPFQDGPEFGWLDDSKTFYYDNDDRGFKAKELRVVDPSSGEQKTLIREQSDQYVDPGKTFYRFATSSQEIVWTSERDGWNHIYLYSQKSGQLINQLTKGPWVVERILHVDEKNRRIYFQANGREKNEDPYQAHLYSVAFDGSGLTALTSENADHSVSISPDGKYFVDNASRPDLPTQSVLRRASDGSEVRTLEKSDASQLTAAGWTFPQPFQGKAGDGTTDLYGLIWKPSNFDASKKYPVIEHVYTGPQGFFAPKTFARALQGGEQAMAELGFIVVMVDGRGTAGRSREFHRFSYHNLGGAFADHVAMIKQMAAKFPYMDANLVGIYGNSAGGYGSTHAMLVFPEFYKVGVSSSGDHDARLDKAWWNELYQGYPVQDDYNAQSNTTMAGQLKGHLLLEHGDIDDNVHPVETMRMVDALIKANKNFDMLFVPNMYHGEGGNLYLARRRWDYFVQYLLGVTPPVEMELKEKRWGQSNGE